MPTQRLLPCCLCVVLLTHQPRAYPVPCCHAAFARFGSPTSRAVHAESLLREYCDFSKEERCIGDTMIGGWVGTPWLCATASPPAE